MTRPTSSSAGRSPSVTASQRERHALARPDSVGHGRRRSSRRPASARTAAANTRRGARSCGTCRGWRRPATAARCRPGAPRGRGAHRGVMRRRALGGAHALEHAPRCAGASLPISTACRTLPSNAARERREVLALAVAAGDQHQRPGQARDRGQGRADVRALGIVDVSARPRCRQPTAIRCARPGKLRARSAPRPKRQPSRLAERQRGERVGGVVRAAMRIAQRQQRSPRRDEPSAPPPSARAA